MRKAIAHVTQDSILFDGSIEENMRIGDLPVSKETIKWALDIACCDQFISLLEYGINTSVGERGQLLSGGQRQRIAIARAILKNAPILILDEATSSLDAESEKLVQDAIDNLSIDRTVIAIAHRLSTIKGSDKIIVIDSGAIAEVGTHDELMTHKGLYHKYINLQSIKTK